MVLSNAEVFGHVAGNKVEVFSVSKEGLNKCLLTSMGSIARTLFSMVGKKKSN